MLFLILALIVTLSKIFVVKSCRSYDTLGHGSPTKEINKGQFWGSQDSTLQIKGFHCEDFLGGRLAGLANKNNKYYVQYTPSATGYGYAYNDATEPGYAILVSGVYGGKYVKDVWIGKFGLLPRAYGGSSTTYWGVAHYYDINI